MAWILVDKQGRPAPVANNWYQTKADAKHAAEYYAQGGRFGGRGVKYKVARAKG